MIIVWLMVGQLSIVEIFFMQTTANELRSALVAYTTKAAMLRADIQLLKRATALNLNVCILESDWKQIQKGVAMRSTIDFLTPDEKWMITKEAGNWHLVAFSNGKWHEISTNASPKVLMEKLEYVLNP